MYDQYQVTTSAEAAAIWGLAESTVRRAIHEKRLPAHKSRGTWLVMTADMQRVYGPPKPATEYPTTGETFYIKTDVAPLTSIGRVPGADGRHVLTTEAGDILMIGGYWLRREDEEWTDFFFDVEARTE